MSLTDKDAFKLGFLARCAEEKLHGEALEQRLNMVEAWVDSDTAKTASNWAKWNPIDIAGLLGSGVSNSWNNLTLGGAALLSAPFALAPVAGGALGYGAAKMVEPAVNDDEIKAQELAATYKLYADKAKARRKARKYRLAHTESPREY